MLNCFTQFPPIEGPSSPGTQPHSGKTVWDWLTENSGIDDAWFARSTYFNTSSTTRTSGNDLFFTEDDLRITERLPRMLRAIVNDQKMTGNDFVRLYTEMWKREGRPLEGLTIGRNNMRKRFLSGTLTWRSFMEATEQLLCVNIRYIRIGYEDRNGVLKEVGSDFEPGAVRIIDKSDNGLKQDT